MEFIIETATNAEAADLYALMRDAEASLPWRDYFVGEEEPYFHDHIEKNGFTVVARTCDRRETAGFLVVDLPGDREENLGYDLGWPREQLSACAHIDMAVVAAAYRGYGLQKKLTRIAETMLIDRGMSFALATVHPDNLPSFKGLSALGYRIAATKLKYGGVPRHILIKNLAPGAMPASG